METENPGVLVLDVPVPHKGYVELFNRYSDGRISTLYLPGTDVLEELEVPKEIRSNSPEITLRMLNGLRLPFDIKVMYRQDIKDLEGRRIYTARDEVSRRLQEKFFPDTVVGEEDIFLRWDESNVTSTRPANVDEETDDPKHVALMERAEKIAPNSSDWWRRVGVVIAKDGQISVEAYNEAFPTNQKPYIDGNPRDFIKAGTLQFLSSTVHAEPAAIAKAARLGISTEGADLYLNSFPCPPCATAMGLAGIRRCFTRGGNAYLDAADVMKSLGIKTIYVKEA